MYPNEDTKDSGSNNNGWSSYHHTVISVLQHSPIHLRFAVLILFSTFGFIFIGVGYLLGDNVHSSPAAYCGGQSEAPGTTRRPTPTVPPSDCNPLPPWLNPALLSTTGWQSFSGAVDDQHFSIQYPPAWSYSIVHNTIFVVNPNYSTTNIGFTPTNSKDQIPLIRLSLTTNPAIASVSARQLKGAQDRYSDPSWGYLNVSGIRADIVYHTECFSGECIDVMFKIRNTLFDLYTETDEQDLRLMLTTFRYE